MAELNVLQICENNDFNVPFIVRRWNWGDNFGLMVIKVEIKKHPYGDAFGYSLPPLNGRAPEPNWGTFENPVNIKCRGCFQWEIVDDAPPAWGACLKREIERIRLYKMEIIHSERGNHSSLKMTSYDDLDCFHRMKQKGLIGV